MRAYAVGSPIREPWVKAAAKGGKAEYSKAGHPDYEGGDSIVWGKIRGARELIKKTRKAGHDAWQMDNGYRGRDKYYRITKNLDQHVGLEQHGPERFESMRLGINFRPWQKGKHILIALSTKHAFAWHDEQIDTWTEMVTKAIRKHSDRPIVVREKNSKGPIEDALTDCHALVTYMSMAALDALQLGVPVFCDEKCAVSPMARPIERLSTIEDPLYPEDRERLYWTLAHHQFNENELKSGMWLNKQ